MSNKNVKNEIISIVVPVYNVEKYLPECIDSLISQTYSNIEIILVNDGSTDNSGEICDNYSKIDNRIKVIHKENGGLSDARNEGLKNISGKLIMFIDSDDYIDRNLVETLYKNLIKEQADISISAYSILLKNKTKDICTPNTYLTLNNKESIDYMYRLKYYSPMINSKLFKVELFDNIYFPVGKLCEDQYTLYKLLYKTKKVVFDSNAKYYYRQRKSSIINSDIYKTNDCIESTKQIMNFVEDKFNEDIESVTLNHVLLTLFYYNALIKHKIYFSKHNKEISSIIKKYKELIKKTNILSNIKKAQIYLFLYFRPFYIIFYKIYTFFRKINYFD